MHEVRFYFVWLLLHSVIMAIADRVAVIPANFKPHDFQILPSEDRVSESPTCYSDLVGGTGLAGKHLELFRLVHGVIGTGNNQGIPRLP